MRPTSRLKRVGTTVQNAGGTTSNLCSTNARCVGTLGGIRSAIHSPPTKNLDLSDTLMPMAFLFLHIRCEECRQLIVVRRPKNTLLIAGIVRDVRCPLCHPESLINVCASCRLPFTVVKRHSNDLCNTCAVRELRYTQGRHATIWEWQQTKRS